MDYKTKVLFNRRMMDFLGIGLDEELATLAAAQSLNLTEIVEESKEKKRFEQEELKEAVENIFEIYNYDENKEGHIISNDLGDIGRGEVEIENDRQSSEVDSSIVLVANENSNRTHIP